MDIFGEIETFFHDLFASWVSDNLTGLFGNINDQVSHIGDTVSLTPQGFNNGIFSFVSGLTEECMVPIGALIITYVLVYDLINMVMEKNNFHEFDTSLFIRYLGKACIAVFLLSHTTEIVEALFELGGDIAISATAEATSKDLTVKTGDSILTTFSELAVATDSEGKYSTPLSKLLFWALETTIIRFGVTVMELYVTILIYGRFMQMYLYMSLSPVAFATLTNREFGSIGKNYIKTIMAFAFQGFLIMVCVGIYAYLISSLSSTSIDDFEQALNSTIVYIVLLMLVMGKTGSIAKSIMNAT